MASLSERAEKPKPAPAEVQQELERIFASREFSQSERMQRFLRFVVERTLEGETDSLKESVIGVQVFDREIGYDPKADSIVRVEARRLRNKLFEYQRESGAQDPFWIILPKGRYVPEFVFPGPRPVEPVLPATPVRQGGSRRIAIAMAVLLCIAAAWLLFRRSAPTPAIVQGTPFTSWPGYEVTPSFSPDGETIAFASRAIYAQRVGDDQAIRLTHSSDPEIQPVWSPDGRQIAFFRQEPGGRLGIYVMSAGGSNEKRVGQTRSTLPIARLDWSPDGRFIATSDREGERAPRILLLSVATGGTQWLTEPQPGDTRDWCPMFSPDGETVAFARQLANNVHDIYLLPIHIGEDGKAAIKPARRLTFDNREIYGHAWSADGRSLIVASRRGDGMYFALWKVAISGGEPVRLTSGDVDAIQPAISRKKNRLAFVNRFTDMNIWRAAVDGKSPAKPLIASTLYDTEPQYSPDGKRIAFRSDRSGNDAIWVADSEGRGAYRVADLNGSPVSAPRWSPDGRLIAFDARSDGQSLIYVAAADARTSPRRMAAPPQSNNLLPSWSHDGAFLYFGSNQSGKWELWKQPVVGDQAEQLTKQGGYAAFEMADGKGVYYSKGPAVQGIWKLPGEQLVLESRTAQKWGWMPGLHGIYFIESGPDEEQPAEIRYFEPGSKVSRLIGRTSAKPAQGGAALSISPDERWIAYAQVDRAGSDIILVKDFR